MWFIPKIEKLFVLKFFDIFHISEVGFDGKSKKTIHIHQWGIRNNNSRCRIRVSYLEKVWAGDRLWFERKKNRVGSWLWRKCVSWKTKEKKERKAKSWLIHFL